MVDCCNKELEKSLLDMEKQKELADKKLLAMETFIGIISTVVLLALIFIAAFAQMNVVLKALLAAIGFVLFVAGCSYALWIEQVAGYYMCKECGHRHVPTYKEVILAQHMGRTRYLSCPKCNKKSWQKKVLSKE